MRKPRTTMRVLLPLLAVALAPTVLPSAARMADAATLLDTDPPTIVAVQPTPDSTGVAVGTNVTADFSEEMDPVTLTTSSVALIEQGGSAAIAAIVTYDSGLTRVTLDPDVDLVTGTMYTATVLGGPSGAADIAGNPLATDQVWSFTTAAPPDTTPPDTSIDSGPTGTVASTTAVFTFSADEAGSTFECSLDAASFTACTSPATFAGLSEGDHTVLVRAVDAALNLDATPASRSWTADSVAPTVGAAPPGGTYPSAQSVTLTASETADIHVTTDGSNPITASPLYSGPITISATTTVKFIAVDPAGNTSSVQTEVYTISVPETTLTFVADADARVEGASPDANFGTSTALRIDTSPVEESYLRFTVGGVTATVTDARLRLWTTNGTTNGPSVYLADNAWTEAGLTWNNRPARIGNATDDLGAIAVGTWAEFSVTPIVTGDGTVTFDLGRTSSDAVHFVSRESTDPALRPQLVVTFSGSPSPPPPPTVAADPPGGTYTTSQSVALTASEPATIHYTTNGSDPTASSPVYSAPLAITASTTLGFFALTSDNRSSAIVTEVYVIDEGAPVTTTFAADADARVESANPAVNYGTSSTLVADASPATETYVRFAASGLTGPVTTATLRLFVFNDTGNGPAVYTASNGWEESTITWGSRPARSGGIDDKGALPVNTWVEFAVTPLVTGNGTFTFVLATSSSDGVSFYSKESANTTLRPQLVVTSAQGIPPVVTSAPTGGTFVGPVDVTLSASEPATIHYTTNGTDPTLTSPIYTAPIHLIETTTLEFIGVDAQGATSPVGTETYTIQGDFVPPETTIGSGPSDPTNQNSATFTFSTNEPGSSFECSLDGAVFTACTTPSTYLDLSAGAHAFQVRASDPAGNVDPTPAGFGWFVDLTAPSVTAVAPTAGATDVAVAANVTADFSEDIAPASLTAQTVQLAPQGSGSPVAATVAYDGPSRRVTLDPESILIGGTTYIATIKGGPGGAVDLAGNPLAADEVWSFTVSNSSNPVTFTVNPVADAWVDSVTPATNYGTATSLTADKSPASQSYFEFTLSGITAPVTSARLRVFAFSSTNDGPAVYAAGNGWTETGVTWDNRPATIGAAADDVPVIASNTWVEYNVAPLVTGNGTYVFALIPTSSDGVDFYSRENGTNQPELIITFGGPPPPTVSATPAGGSYPHPVTVTLAASEPATIHYTADGTTPTTASPVYTAPLSVAVSQTLRFFAITPDLRPSTVVTEVYSIAVTGYRDVSFGSASAPTAKEGQSKVWHTGDAWFGALFDSVTGDFHLFRLDEGTQVWTDTGTLIDARNTARIDALWDGSKLYTVSAVWGTSTSSRAEVRRFSYVAGVYSLDPGFPVVLNSTGAEAITIDKAGDGRLWVSYAAGSKIYATHTLGGDTSWTTPFVIPGTQSSVSADDISAVVAFGNAIGVLWSNQNANTMYFGVHQNGAADSSWTIEAAYGVPGQESADDHINLKADSSGRVYAAVKTSLNAVGEPLIHLLVREPVGGWTSHAWGTAERNHTRPVVVLSEQANRIWLFASAPCCSGGVIYVKDSALTNISFAAGMGSPIIASNSDPAINNVASTKQSVTASTGLLIIAGDDSTNFYLHNLLTVS